MAPGASRPDAAIAVHGLSKSFGALTVLRGLDLAVRHGEVFGFLGHEGAGKTTTIRCLLDLVRPDGGTIRMLGVDPQTDPGAIQAQVGYLPTILDRDEELTPRQLLKHFDALHGGGMDWAYTLTLADRFELALDKPIKGLSRGNKQKVRLLKAFLHKPPVLLLDEPTRGLDPRMQETVLQWVRELKTQTRTVLLASRHWEDVRDIADRVGVLRAGQVVDNAPPAVLTAGRYADVVLWEACDPGLFTRLEGIRVLGNRGNKQFLLHISGELDALFHALSVCKIQRFATQRTAPGSVPFDRC
jgi:ABC-2 type transport system ATP-binding protein